MMERAEKAGLGVALVGHAALFAALSLRLLTPPLPVPPPEQAIEVSLAPDVALQQASPAPAPPAPSAAPEQGAPEKEAVPEPPAPKPAPAPPRPRPAPAKPTPPAAKPNPDRLASVVADAERADAARAEKAAAKAAAHAAWVDKVKAENAAKAEAAKAAADKAEAARVAAAAAKTEAHAAWVERVKADNAAKAAAAATRARGSRLSNDFLKGLADTPAKRPPAAAAPGAVMSAKAAADIGSAILRQVQPCADRQVIPGPGAERISVSVNLKLNRDGSLGAPPRVVNHAGIDVDNRRYLDRVDDLAIATFKGCAPLRGLPAALYDVPNGWRSFTLVFNLRG